MIRKKKKTKLPEIQMTSLPDIIFMLLFFFMVVTVLRKKDSSSAVALPTVSYAELLDRDDILPVAILERGGDYRYQLRNKKYRNLNHLETALKAIYLAEGQIKVKLVADRTITMQRINELKELFQKTHFNKVEYLVLKGV